MKELQEFIGEMRSTSSATDKIAIITRSSAFIHKVLEATYNPYKQYHVTGKTCKKNNDLLDKAVFDFMDGDIFKLLNSLTRREFTGHKAIGVINGFVDFYGQIIYKIIDKDLDIRVGASTINKAVLGLIPTFKVALAQNYEGKCEWNDRWWVSRKLDGVRCLAITDDEGKCRLYSRMGKEFTTLDKVKDAIEATGKTCKKNNDLLDKAVFDFMDGDIFKLLNSLTRREFTGHKAIGVINGFVDFYGQIIYKIIDKDLDIRVVLSYY